MAMGVFSVLAYENKWPEHHLARQTNGRFFLLFYSARNHCLFQHSDTGFLFFIPYIIQWWAIKTILYYSESPLNQMSIESCSVAFISKLGCYWYISSDPNYVLDTLSNYITGEIYIFSHFKDIILAWEGPSVWLFKITLRNLKNSGLSQQGNL